MKIGETATKRLEKRKCQSARQRIDENPCKCKTWLLKYLGEASLQDERLYIENYAERAFEGLERGKQQAKNQIREIHQLSEASQESDGTDTEMLTSNALMEDENWSEASKRHHQPPKITEGLPSDKPGYENLRLDQELEVEKDGKKGYD